jgi:predicted ATPase/DNA-binding SARP family transcriptional activator
MLGGLRLLRLDAEGVSPTERLRTQKTAALLGFLAYKRGIQPREKLCDEFWPGKDLVTARGSLRVALSSLRKVLEPEDIEAGAVLLVSIDTVEIGPGIETDVEAFLVQIEAAKIAADDGARRTALEKMFALYGGPLLDGIQSEWIVSEAHRLEDLFIHHTRDLLALLEAAGELETALNTARCAVALTPLREEMLREMLGIGFKLGQHEAMMAEFEAWRKNAEKRGLSVGGATLELMRLARKLPPPAPSPLKPLPVPPKKRDVNAQPVTLGRSLPGQLTTFIGRNTELDTLREWLAEPTTRLITLTGPGGGGKTRLALELARHLVRTPHIDEQTSYSLVEWVSLADLPTANLIPGAILDALRAPRGQEQIDDLLAALRDGLKYEPDTRLLLVFDNFEHLWDEGAPLIRTLIEAVPELVCLVTSRRRLGFMGEREWPLQTLEVPTSDAATGRTWVGFEALAPSSVRLFLDRARLARPDFELTTSNADAIAKLCARLDGLPLTLELAAARVALFSPAQILAGLDNQLQKHLSESDALEREALEFDPDLESDLESGLESGLMAQPTSLDWANQDRAAPLRHRSLRAAIAWSERQLPPAAARFWTQLSVFRGGWTLDAAASVCEEPDAAPLVLSLRDVSLISLDKRGEPPRGNQLQALREYAAEGLSPAMRAEVAERHARYFLNWAETLAPQLDMPRASRYLRRFEDERGNLRAALEWHLQHDVEGALRLVGALWWSWELRGRIPEGRAALARVLEAAKIAFPKLESGEEEVEGDDGIAQQQRRLHILARARNGAGKLATVASDFEVARAYLEAALVTFRQLHDNGGVADCLYSLGYMRLKSGDLDGARGLCDESIAIYRALGERGALCDALYNRSLVALYESDFATVRLLIGERLIIHQAIGDTRGVAISLENLGLAALFSGEAEAARAYQEEALALLEKMKEWPSVMRVLWGLGHSLRVAGFRELARESFARALRLSREHKSLWSWPYLIEAFAALAAEEGDTPRAVRLLGAAAIMRETYNEPLPSPMFRQEIETALTALRAALGDALFESEWQLGRAVSRESLVVFALREDENE